MASSSASSGNVAVPGVPASGPSPGTGLPAQVIQQLVDQSAGFNLYVVPDQTANSNSNSDTGLVATEKLHRFDVVLQEPGPGIVQANNIYGEVIGGLNLRWSIIPDDFLALPDRQPPSTRLNPAVSQRFVMQEMTFRFGSGEDGFKSFGTGRTFPMMVGNQPRIVIGAIGNVTEGFGKFRGHEGNFTLCGDLLPNGFQGNLLVRFQDSQGDVRTQAALPAIQSQAAPDPAATYLLWAAQKGEEQRGIENHFSFGPDRQVRGMNITTQLKVLQFDFAAACNFEVKNFTVGQNIIGLEIGFGRGSIPNASPTGTALSPFLFEGVAQYSFFDRQGKTVGALLTNVLEGRRFDMALPGAPGAPATRFGFFGPIVYGTGCFAGVEGMFYGSSGSVFYPPPGDHVVTHFYMARINDPSGKFRAAAKTGGWY
jgi:hypothetical protein